MPGTEIKPYQLNPSILERISEQDVQNWLAAKLHQLHAEFSPLVTLEISARHCEYATEKYYDLSVTAHGGGKCATSKPNICTAVEELRNELLSRPSEEAREKRVRAKRLLREAKELENLAAASTTSN